MAYKLFIFLLLSHFIISAQESSGPIQNAPPPLAAGTLLPNGDIIVRTIVYEGETIPYITLAPVVFSTKRIFKNKREAIKWDRLKYNVKKVYPYAILAAAKLKEYDRILAMLPSEKEKKEYMKLAEEQLKVQFGEELKNLSINQGRILLKLVDRETGKTTYNIVKDMRGSFSAFMWQSLSLVFNSSLKSEYDATGTDKDIEQAIQLIESGEF
jgi:Domain of unknown function (DUF4294)